MLINLTNLASILNSKDFILTWQFNYIFNCLNFTVPKLLKHQVRISNFRKKNFTVFNSRPQLIKKSSSKLLTLSITQPVFNKSFWVLIGMVFFSKTHFNDSSHMKHRLKWFKKSQPKKPSTLLKKSQLNYLKTTFQGMNLRVDSGVNYNERIESRTTWSKPYLFLGKLDNSPKYLNFLNQSLVTKSKLWFKNLKRKVLPIAKNFLKKSWSIRVNTNRNTLQPHQFNSVTAVSKRKFFKKYLKHRSLQKQLFSSLFWLKKSSLPQKKLRDLNFTTNPAWVTKFLHDHFDLALYKLRRKKEFLSLLHVQKFVWNPYTLYTPSLSRSIVLQNQVLQSVLLNRKLVLKKKKSRTVKYHLSKVDLNLVSTTNYSHYTSHTSTLYWFNSKMINKMTIKKSDYTIRLKFQLFSTHGLSFILPLYGFLFLTSYQSTVPSHHHLLTNQKYSFLYLNDFKKLLLNKFSKTAVFNRFFFEQKKWAQPTILSSLNDKPSSSDLLSYFSHTYKNIFDATQTRDSLTSEGLTLQRIKFKPGYSRLWRVARITLKFLLNLKFTYQKKLTRYLVKFFRLNKLVLLKFNELKLSTVLTTTLLVPDRENALLLISNNLVFVNGGLVLNSSFLIFKNDFLQLLVSLKYYILFRWLKNFQLLKRKRLSKFISNISLRTLNKDRKKNRLLLPSWTLEALLFNYDVPNYLEVDFFSLSAFCLYEPFLPQDFNPSLWNLEKTSIYNLYNWKYIT